jgi:hypothetical protein
VKNKFGYIVQVIMRSDRKNAAFEPIN